MNISLNRPFARSLIAGLLGCVAALTVLGGFALAWRDATDDSMLVRQYVSLFHPGLEQCLPAWFSSSVMIMIAGSCALVMADRRQHAGGHAHLWGALAPIFVFLSADEAVGIHERVGALVKHAMHTTGMFTFAWVIPGIAVVGVLVILYARFVRDLPRGIRGLVVLSACLYIGGALGMEMVSGAIKTRFGEGDLYYCEVAIEEFLEMVGLVAFLGATLRLLTERAQESEGRQSPTGESARSSAA